MTQLGLSVRDGYMKMRGASGRGDAGTGVLSVPAHMRRLIPADSWFRAEWHADGLLYRFMGTSPDLPPNEEGAPEWTK